MEKIPCLAAGHRRKLRASSNPSAGASPRSPTAARGCFPGWRSGAGQLSGGSRARRSAPCASNYNLPLRLQLTFAKHVGRHSEVGLGALPHAVCIQILGRRLQLIRARRGGGKPGIRLCPAARPRRGMVSPSPARRAPEPTSNRGAAWQPHALGQPRGKREAGGLLLKLRTLCRRF